MNPYVVFFLGPPCSGKGTQCDLISDEFHLHHISAGDLLRKEAAKGDTPEGLFIRDAISTGTLVPPSITVRLLDDSMQNDDKFLIDGFPRNIFNLECWLDSEVGKRSRVLFVVHLTLDKDEVVRRCIQRQHDRCDDQLEVVSKRLEVYEVETLPVLKYFEELGMVHTVDGIGTKEEVYERVKTRFCRAQKAGLL